MTDQEINAAIAEACGWRVLRMREAAALGLYKPGPTQDLDAWDLLYAPDNRKMAGSNAPKPLNDGHWTGLIHNYCTDLNAMREAEKTLITLGKHWEYPRQMRALILQTEGGEVDFYYYHATARQRAEAFLRTLGKWNP